MSRSGRIAELRAPKGHCRGCQKPVPKGRFTWCSDACVKAARIKTDPSYARWLVEQRDRGVCAECGFDTAKAERILNRLLYWDRVAVKTAPDAVERGRAIRAMLNVWLQPKRSSDAPVMFGPLPHLWEADHIVPVAEGGGGCDIDNYRTLCVPCHKAATKALVARLAEARRAGKMTLLEQAIGDTRPSIERTDGRCAHNAGRTSCGTRCRGRGQRMRRLD